MMQTSLLYKDFDSGLVGHRFFCPQVKNFIQMSNSIKEQVTNLQVTDGLAVAIIKNQTHEFVMTTKEVAKGYDCTPRAVNKAFTQHSGDLIEGKHFFFERNDSFPSKNLKTTKRFITKRGVVRLGFFLRTSRAKLFRDWAEDLIIDKIDEITEQPRSTKKGVARLPYNESEKDVLGWIKDHLVYGDYDKIAQHTGYSVPSVSLVLNRKHVNERILKEAYRVAIDNKIQGKDDATSVYSPAFISDAMQTIKKLGV